MCGSSQLPQTLAETVAHIESFALGKLGETVIQQGLYYHTEEHVRQVKRRSHQILNTLASALKTHQTPHPIPFDFDRARLLLDLCAAAHDMVQIFEQNTQQHAARRRLPGKSEAATLDQLIPYIHHMNRLIRQCDPNSSALLTDTDIATIQDAINATICAYSPLENSIYQPLLYEPGETLSIVARILALADLGALGMDGIDAYNQEGSLLFLEENPDTISLFDKGSIYHLETVDAALGENIRQRLLKRSRFQVSFAKSRLSRLQHELQGFQEGAIPTLMNDTFHCLKPATIQMIHAKTPTQDDASLSTLLRFFELEKYLSPRQYGVVE